MSHPSDSAVGLLALAAEESVGVGVDTLTAVVVVVAEFAFGMLLGGHGELIAGVYPSGTEVDMVPVADTCLGKVFVDQFVAVVDRGLACSGLR